MVLPLPLYVTVTVTVCVRVILYMQMLGGGVLHAPASAAAEKGCIPRPRCPPPGPCYYQRSTLPQVTYDGAVQYTAS